MIIDVGISVEFEVGNGCSERRFAADLYFLAEASRKFRDEAEDEGGLLSRFDDIVVVVAVEFAFGIFEAMLIDFLIIFDLEFDVDCRIANIFDLDVFLLDVEDGYLEVEL